MILIGFLFYRSHVVSERPGYMIDGVLSRGTHSQVNNLIASLWRAQTLHTCHIIFLGSYLVFSLLGFGACCDLHGLGNTSSSPRASVISIPELFSHALYIVIAFVLEVFYLAFTLLHVLLSISCWCT